MTLAEDIAELEKRFNKEAQRPVVRLATENRKAMVRKAKENMRHRYIAAAKEKHHCYFLISGQSYIEEGSIRFTNE